MAVIWLRCACKRPEYKRELCPLSVMLLRVREAAMSSLMEVTLQVAGDAPEILSADLWVIKSSITTQKEELVSRHQQGTTNIVLSAFFVLLFE